MHRKSHQQCSSKLQEGLPNIWSHMAHRNLKRIDRKSKKGYNDPFVMQIEAVQKSIQKTIHSIEKLEASISQQKDKYVNKHKSKLKTEVSAIYRGDDQDVSMKQFYQNIDAHKNILRKISRNYQNQSSSGSSSKFELTNQKCNDSENKMFDNIKTILEKKFQSKYTSPSSNTITFQKINKQNRKSRSKNYSFIDDTDRPYSYVNKYLPEDKKHNKIKLNN